MFGSLGATYSNNGEEVILVMSEVGVSKAEVWKKYNSVEEMVKNETNLKWIPYDTISDIKFIAKGGCGTVSSAKVFDEQKKEIYEVALKSVNKSSGNEIEFMDEVNYYYYT